MSLARAFLLFTYGAFSIAAQSLLFREFLTTFEGDDISIGVFFACWFIWVGVSALLIYRIRLLANWLAKRIELLLLAYIPAFIIEALLIINARELAHIESYALVV